MKNIKIPVAGIKDANALNDLITRFVAEKYIGFIFVTNDNNSIATVDEVQATKDLMNLYNTNIEDKEKKLEYIVNMVFPNGTMFDTYNTAENIKKEFNMYIKNYIN